MPEAAGPNVVHSIIPLMTFPRGQDINVANRIVFTRTVICKCFINTCNDRRDYSNINWKFVDQLSESGK